MGCCDGCGRIILVVINVIFSIIGILMLSVGCVVRFGSDLLDEYLQDAYNAFAKAVKEINDNIDISDLEVGDLFREVTLAFIIIGAFFFVIGIVGCIGACCKVRPLLIIYIVVLVIIFIAEVVFVILLFSTRSTIDEWLRDPLVREVKKDYTGTNGTDAFSLALNFVMHEFKCCGIADYKDFENATKFHRFDNNTGARFEVPLICCKNVSDESCAVAPTLENANIDKGCYEAFDDWLSDNKGPVIGVGAAIPAFQLILIIFSIVICCKAGKDDDADSYGEEIPIHPYRESREAHGHRNKVYNGSPVTEHTGHGYGQYGSDKQSTQDYPTYHPEPYKGKSEAYTGPPEGYRSDHGYKY